MVAAGIAWERAMQAGTEDTAAGDMRWLRTLVTAAEVPACIRTAEAMLVRLAPLHGRVTRALAERDLTARDVAKLVRGERLAL